MEWKSFSASHRDCHKKHSFTHYLAILKRIMAEDNRSLTPEKLIKLLQEKGIEIPPDHSEKVINFLYLLASIVINHTLEQ